MKLFKGLNGARTLALNVAIFSEVPNTPMALILGLLTSYTNLKKLELKASVFHGTCLTWLASLLYHCSSIETLVLQTIQYCPREKEKLTLPLCTLNNLKYIVVWGLEGHDNELELLRFLFKIALNLERLVTTGGGSKNSEIEKGDLLNFQDKLMALSQDLSNVEVSFQIL